MTKYGSRGNQDDDFCFKASGPKKSNNLIIAALVLSALVGNFWCFYCSCSCYLMFCLRRNCTNGKRIFVHYALRLFFALFAQIWFTCDFVLCYASKSSVKDAGSISSTLFVVAVVVSPNKKQRKKGNVQTYTHTPNWYAGHIHTYTICILAAQTFPRVYIHTTYVYVHTYICRPVSPFHTTTIVEVCVLFLPFKISHKTSACGC